MPNPPERPVRLFRDPEPVEVTGRSAGRTAASFRWRRALHRVAARRRARAHRAGMVARQGEDAADTRLFPRRGRGRPPLLALPRRALRRRRRRRRAGSCTGFSHERDRFRPPMPSSPSSRISPSCAAPPGPRNWSSPPSCSAFRRSALPTATRLPAWCAPGSRLEGRPELRLSSRLPPGLCRRHARHPRLSAGPQGLGASLPHADPGQSARRERKGRPASLARRSARMGRPACRLPCCPISTPTPTQTLALLRQLERSLRRAVSACRCARLSRQRPLPAGAGGRPGGSGRHAADGGQRRALPYRRSGARCRTC